MKVLFITDTHLKDSTVDINNSIFDQLIKYAKKHNIDTVFHAGDIFTSRKAQTELTLNAFTKILDEFNENGITLYAIPGNHDKTDYESYDSFLDVYKHHPAFNLTKAPQSFIIDDKVNIVLLPYFDESTMYINELKKANNLTQPNMVNLLLTHAAINGVKNNDGSKVQNALTKVKFKKFDKVLVGHYHDISEFNNIYYFGSAYQANFGENDKKGFLELTLKDDKVVFKHINTQFNKYIKFKVDIAKETIESVAKKALQEKENGNFVRIEIIGEESVIKSVNTANLKKSGIDVKLKQTDIIEGVEQIQVEGYNAFNESTIIDEFKIFCADCDKKDEMLKYLKQQLKINSNE